ncbi:hypothetical protein [Tumebacillus lipolyticus]|uniref:Uncharacterized protein n=1 Tax=Tumebacillus lipolyticus TaxID=1280370 RepID=A0ABW5A1P3_9BACL
MDHDNSVICTSNQELTVNHLYTIEDYLTLNIQVRSGDFAGSSNFCISKENAILISRSLSDMHKKLMGSCAIEDYDSDAHLQIEVNSFGRVLVYGQIGGSHEDHYMKFKFISDQAALELLRRLFLSYIKYY